MNKIQVAEMVGDMYWYRLPDGSDPLEHETAVQLVAEYADVDRAKAMGLLLEHCPSRRADRARLVNRVADMVVAGAIDRVTAMNTVAAETGMSLGWCAAALADAVVERRAQARRDDGRWSA